MLQPRKSLERLPEGVFIEYRQVAVTVDRPGRAPQLDRDDDEAYQPEYEEHERSNHDYGRQESHIHDKPYDEGDESNNEAPDGDKIGKVPIIAINFLGTRAPRRSRQL